jgi:hypothetical protein
MLLESFFLLDMKRVLVQGIAVMKLEMLSSIK